MLNKILNYAWIQIEWRDLDINVKYRIPKYVPATLEQPSEGGLNELEILKIEYDGESLLKAFTDSDCILVEIEDKIKLKLM